MLDLFKKYLQDEISGEELQELMVHFAEPDNRAQWMELIRNTLDEGQASVEQVEQLNGLLSGLDSSVLARVKAMADADERIAQKRRFRVLYWRAAAVLVVALMVGAIFYFDRSGGESRVVENVGLSDIAPGGNRAVLTLEGGQPIELDSTQTGVTVEKRGIRYTGGTMVAAVGKDAAEAMQYATLATPKGGQYQVTLPDGTQVWLNASSSLRYPTQFTGGLREVELTGEGYFEVASNKAMPFVVKSGRQVVEVLGTAFNINAYEDEAMVATTLVKGAVHVSRTAGGSDERELKPGQQAVLQNGHIDVKNVEVSYYTGWKEGKFIVNREKLSVVLRQIERWYDVEFVNERIDEDIRLWGTLSRNAMLSELLAALELNTGYTFKKEGRRVIMSR